MNRNYFGMLILLIGLSIGGSARAGAQMIEISSFERIYDYINQSSPTMDLTNTLIVMDDDDTLTMMPCPNPISPEGCQYLGGPAWFKWQSDMIATSKANKSNSLAPGQITTDSATLFAISDLLLSLNNMEFADPTISTTLQSFANNSAKLMVLTARDTDSVSATEAQMNRLQIQSDFPNQDLLNYIAVHAPIWNKTGKNSMAGTETFTFCSANRPVAYQNGLFFSTGQNKGTMLECFLQNSDVEKITNIVFIDDTIENVQNVYDIFSNNPSYNVTAIHYTHLSEHKNTFLAPNPVGTLNKYQIKATSRWNAIQDALKSNLLEAAGMK